MNCRSLLVGILVALAALAACAAAGAAPSDFEMRGGPGEVAPEVACFVYGNPQPNFKVAPLRCNYVAAGSGPRRIGLASRNLRWEAWGDRVATANGQGADHGKWKHVSLRLSQRTHPACSDRPVYGVLRVTFRNPDVDRKSFFRLDTCPR